MQKRFFITFIFLNLATIICGQQEAMYTQFMYNKMSLNPAVSGIENYTTLTGIIRDQWNGIPGAPKTQLLTCNFRRIKDKFGFGFRVNNNSIGISKNLTYAGMYSYKFLINDELTLSMGLEASGRNLVLDYTKTSLFAYQGLENDASIPKEKINRHMFNLGYGIYLNTEQFFVGASVPRLIKNDFDFDQNKIITEEVRHVYLMGGGFIQLKRGLILNTQTLLKFAENSPFDVDLSIGVTIDDKYTGGISYRFGGGNGDIGESIDMLFGFNITDNIFLGFSNDFTVSNLRSQANGSIEVLLQYNIGKKKKKIIVVNPRYF